jgi:hypothetical protein
MNRLIRPLLVVSCALLVASAVQAQPFHTYFGSNPEGTHSYVEVPHSNALNPTGGFTVEFLVQLAYPGNGACDSLVGQNWQQAWWIGACGDGAGHSILRSYLKGGTSQRNGGVIPDHRWVHVAVTFDGAKRRHYIEGELVAEFNETGPLSTSPAVLRILSDAAWPVTPTGGIREVRLWNVARGVNQLRALINRNVTTAQPGLVAVWPLAGNAQDVISTHDGVVGGNGAFWSYSGNICTPSAIYACFSSRFRVRTFWWIAPAGASGDGTVVPGFSSDSANFWFFSAPNWELLVKTVDGCGLNNRHWIFYAPVTNVHYVIEVFDTEAESLRHFYGYQGLTDGDTNTDAFPTCP